MLLNLNSVNNLFVLLFLNTEQISVDFFFQFSKAVSAKLSQDKCLHINALQRKIAARSIDAAVHISCLCGHYSKQML